MQPAGGGARGLPAITGLEGKEAETQALLEKSHKYFNKLVP